MYRKEIKPDIKSSLEGYQMVYEKLINQEKAIEIINNKLEKQDVEITVIKGGKKEIIQIHPLKKYSNCLFSWVGQA